MTTRTTILYFRTGSDSKLSNFQTALEMPSVTNDPALSVLSNSANSNPSNHKSSSIDIPRKSNDKTISGVFAYTNGTDVETGLPDHRLEQFRGLKTSSVHSLSGSGTGVNGVAVGTNGNLRGGNTASNGATRSRAHSKAGSTHSLGSLATTEKDYGNSGATTPLSRNLGSSEALSRLSNVETAAEGVRTGKPPRNGEASEQRRSKPELRTFRSEGYTQPQQDSAAMFPESLRADGQATSPTVRSPSSVHRFSSPPAMSPTVLNAQDPTLGQPHSPEPPRLTQRHTLQVPRTTGSIPRSSRDFSFSAGDEVLTTTGRFSPTREYDAAVPRHRRPSLGLVRRTTRSMQSDAHLDEVPPDEDAARWTEVIKQKRASRRKRKEEEDDDRVIVGKKVEEGHVNWVTAYNMLTGIRFTVSRTNAKIDRELTDADFDAKHKFSFDVTGNELTPSAKYDFKFKDYSPWVFRHLRAIFGLDPADYLMSLTSKYILSELGSPGKSGSFFYFSRDYKYIIKTIHHAEHKLLRKILRDYYAHVRDNPNTLISQFYGLHRVKIPYGRKIHFVVMNNLFPPHRDIHQTFDLKGSTIGRDFKEEDLASNPRATLKDLNWLRRNLHLEFQQQVKRMFLEQIQKDVALLQRLHIMDYSLLVGMHDLEKGNEEKLRETTLQVFQPGGERDESDEIPRGAMLLRTPSRLENARKARELRQTLKKEKPRPMTLVSAKMPDEMNSTDERQGRIFYSDDGGIRATHEDGSGGDMIYYLGIIDCLTHYGLVKRIEHFWKGLSNPRTQISPIPPEAYGERFINFITGITMTKEEAERRKTIEGANTDNRESVDAHNIMHHHHIPPLQTSFDGTSTENRSPLDTSASPGSPAAVDKTMRKAQKQAEKTMSQKEGKTEDDLPERRIKTVTVPEADEQAPTGPRNSTTLPVVEEVGENSSDISSQHSDKGRAASESREEESPMPSTALSEKERLGIRQVSASTAGQRNSLEEFNEKRDFQLQPQHHSQGLTPASEPFTPVSPNYSRPLPSNGHSPTIVNPPPGSTAAQQLDRTKPPRLNSDLIPHLTPMYASPEALDPEKSVLNMDGEVLEGVEKLPGLALGDRGTRSTMG